MGLLLLASPSPTTSMATSKSPVETSSKNPNGKAARCLECILQLVRLHTFGSPGSRPDSQPKVEDLHWSSVVR